MSVLELPGIGIFCYLRFHGHGPTPFEQSKEASLNEEDKKVKTCDVIFSLFFI